MLAGLDAIDWSALTHAYGPADDVPGLLRKLASPHEKDRSAAIADLFGNIWHQGTVYPATAAAVPFLYELLLSPETHDKTHVAHLLACIAEGTGYLEVHTRMSFPASMWKDLCAKKGTTLEEEMAREAEWVAAVRQAVSAGLQRLLPYLHDEHAEVRCVIAAALGAFPEHASWTAPALEAALASESDDDVKPALVEAIEKVARTS